MNSKDYILGPNKISQKIIFISGTGRAGKTLLSKMLASHSNVEWIEEPYALINPLVMRGLGMMEEDMFRKLFTSCVHEIIVDHVLLRNGNFRPDDLSSIWNYKTAGEIFYRLKILRSRSDVEEYIKEKDPYFIIDIPEILPFAGYLRELCDDLTIINVVRDPFEVADDCYRKGWFASDDKQIAFNNLFRIYGEHRLPWWVKEGEEDAFVSAPLYEKGLMYWLAIQAYEKDESADKSKYDLCVRYEDMVKDTDGVLDMLRAHIDMIQTSVTNGIKSEIISGYNAGSESIPRSDDHIDKILLRSTMSRFGY